MRRLLRVTMLVLCLLLTACEDKIAEVGDVTVDKIYSEGGKFYSIDNSKLITGRVFMYYEDGSILGDMEIEEGILNGESNYYHPNGKVKSKTIVDGLNSEFKIYTEEGVLIEKGKTVEEQLVGNLETYYADGKKKSIAYYEKGIVDGVAELYSPDGDIVIEEYYEKGLRLYQKYYLLEKLKREVMFDNNDAFIKEYYDDGERSLEMTLSNGIKNGEFKTYYEDGTLKSNLNYENGVPIGKHISYDVDGEIEREVIYKRRKEDVIDVVEGVTYRYSGGSTGYLGDEAIIEHYEKVVEVEE